MKPNAAHDDMKTWWDRAIETNAEALEQIVILLLRLAGIGTLVPEVETLPRALRTRILHILRPAEFAMRRLILIAASQIRVTVPPAPDSGNSAHAPSPSHSLSLGLPKARPEGDTSPPLRRGEETHDQHTASSPPQRGGEVSSEARRRGGDPAGARNEPAQIRAPATIPVFALFDPFKHYGDPFLTEAEIAALDDPARNDRFLALAHLPPDEPVPAKALCRRIVALRHALQDLEAHALRLARWTARRHLERTRPSRLSALCPGLPPGWKRRPKTGTEEVVKECHTLALIALRPPDTS
jgi:hypothetical protein